MGGVLAAGPGRSGLRFLGSRWNPRTLPRLHEIALDGRALVRSRSSISVLSGLLFGLIPAVKYAAAPAADSCRPACACGGRTSSQSKERHLRA